MAKKQAKRARTQPAKRAAPGRAKATGKAGSVRPDARDLLAWLKQAGDARTLEEMGPRYGIHTPRAFGVKVGVLRSKAKAIGHDHELALSLWETGWYEARMLACFVDDPALVTPAQMDRWCRDFDNWAICDTACFHLFDRTEHAWKKVGVWCKRRDEFTRRAGFALLASLALHDKRGDDGAYLDALDLIEGGADDDRNFVKKGVSWALRAIGKRGPTLRAAAVEVAERLAVSDLPGERWVGKDALRELRKGRGKRV